MGAAAVSIPMTKAKPSISDSGFEKFRYRPKSRDHFEDWVGSSQFGPDHLHHPVPPNRRFPDRAKTGRLCGYFRRYLSALSAFGDTCGLSGRFQAPVSASKNSVPRGRVVAGVGRLGTRDCWEFFGPKRTFRARSVLIVSSIRGLRTAGSILPERLEVALLQCRVASNLRPQPARDLVQGTRARSSC
jgi:hypothetical protein